MSDGEPPQPLPGDPPRRAVPSLRGYAYQIWRTIEQWVTLKSGETLFIECAEDFDVTTSKGAKAVQVKDTKANISLASQDARDAILNFLQLRNRANQPVRFQFLTRSGIATEQGELLDRKAGILLWREAATGNRHATARLRRYLLDKYKDQPELTSFLNSRTAEELEAQLFRLFDWVTDEPDSDVVKEVIRRRLVSHGEQIGCGPAVSARAIDALYAHCWEVAQRGSPEARSLTREDFLLVFSRATSLPVPMAALGVASFAGTMGLSPGAGSAVPVNFALKLWTHGVPPLPDPVLKRPAAVASAVKVLQQLAPLVLAASIGKGKTTLAKIIASALVHSCAWVDLSGRDSYYSETALATLALWLEDQATPHIVVVDDFLIETNSPQGVWTSFEILNRACRKSGSRLLITTKGITRERLDSRLLAAGAVVQNVDDLSEAEIQELFEALGCPSKDSKQWAALTRLHTGGHPKLVHVRALDLRDQGWLKPTTTSIFQTPASIEGQKANERIGLAQRETGERLDFLYHLTLIALPFDRELAVRIGAKIKDLSDPGTTFDSLLGRWIEPSFGSYYKVTSLLTNEANKAWSFEKLERAHATIFDAFLAARVLDGSYVLSVFMHAFSAKSAFRITRFVMGLIGAKKDTFAQIAREFKLAVHFGRGVGTLAIAFNARASAFFRILQFRVAAREAPEELSRIAAEWKWEVDHLPAEPATDSIKLVWATTVALSIEGDLPPKLIVEALSVIDANSARIKVPLPPKELRIGLESQDPLTQFFSFFHARCRNVEYLSDLLDALVEVPELTRNRMLAATELPFFADYSFIVERAWAGELSKPSQDWVKVLRVLERTRTLAHTWKATKLGLSAARAISIVLDEHQDHRLHAMRALEEGSALFGSAPMLQEQRANICFQHNELVEALEQWRRCLAVELQNPSDKVKEPFAFRKAAMCAGKLGNLQEAADLFFVGAHWAGEAKLAQTRAGLLFDSAYAAFKAKNYKLTSETLREGIALIVGRPDPEKEFRQFALQKLGSYVALWIHTQITGAADPNTVEPIFGCCSNPTYDSGIKDLPRSPIELPIAFAVEFEHRAGLPQNTEKAFSQVLRKSRIPALHMLLASVHVEQVFRNGNFKNLLEPLEDMRLAFSRAKAQHRLQQNTVEEFLGKVAPADEVNISFEYFFLLALTLYIFSGGIGSDLLRDWKVRDKSRFKSIFRKNLTRLEHVIGEASETRGTALEDPKRDNLERLAAAHFFIVGAAENPRVTAYAQIGFVMGLLMTDARHALRESVPALSRWFSEAWGKHIRQPALLYSPRSTIPDLEKAISFGPIGAKKLLMVLFAAGNATGIRIPQNVLEWLRNSAVD